jgi:hypothetical protein
MVRFVLRVATIIVAGSSSGIRRSHGGVLVSVTEVGQYRSVVAHQNAQSLQPYINRATSRSMPRLAGGSTIGNRTG